MSININVATADTLKKLKFSQNVYESYIIRKQHRVINRVS